MNKDQFLTEINKLGIVLSENQIILLEKYYHLLIEWNKKINLTTIVEEQEVYLKHFYDSLTLIKVIDLNKPLKICDIGTGAGFPGIVLKICFPKLNITLLDSLKKRTIFLQEVINTLSLEDINVVCDRAEIYAKSHNEEYDVVVSRAVAKINVLSELSIPLLKIGGNFIAMKGDAKEELATSKNGIKILGGKIDQIVEFYLINNTQKRTLISIRKISKTDQKYPRVFDKIKKNPL